MGLSWDEYATKSMDEKKGLFDNLIKESEARYKLKEDDQQLTHDKLIDACSIWKKKGRLTDEENYKWVEDRHVLAAATYKDIELLLDTKSAFYGRLSDECLYETRTFDGIVNRLARTRYRTEVGLTNKAVENTDSKK